DLANDDQLLDETRRQIAALESQMSQDRRSNEALRTKLKQLEARPVEADNAQVLVALRQQVEERQGRIADQELQIKQLQDRSSQQASGLCLQLRNVEAENADLKKQLGGAEAELSAANSQLDGARAKQTALEQESAKLRAAAQNSETELHLREAQLQQQAARSAADSSVGSALSAALGASRAEVERL